MLTRRGLFSALVGAVAAVFGVKAASKLALNPKAFGMVWPQTNVVEMTARKIHRFDILYGFSVLQPELMCRVYEDGEVHHGEVIRVVPPTRFVED